MLSYLHARRAITPGRSGSCRPNSSRCLSPRSSHTSSTAPSLTGSRAVKPSPTRLPGDRLIFANGRTDAVTAANIPAVSLHLARGRCSIALFMPGKDEPDAITGNDAIRDILADMQITAEDFRKASTFCQDKV